MKIRFLGAAREVTGSCHLVEAAGVRFLVDCGLFQGGREALGKNRAALDFDPDSIDFVIITHAHVDHSGLLPRLAALGYRGPVYATPATAEFLAPMLADSAHLQESDAAAQMRRLRRVGRRGEVAPLYTVQQARDCLRLLRPHRYDQSFSAHRDVVLTFRDAGHILGSAIVEAQVTEGGRTMRLVFSGDLGMPDRPLVRDPTPVRQADVLVVESTYANRDHRSLADTYEELADALNRTQAGHGNVIIPAFALGRTQTILLVMLDLIRLKRVRPQQVFVDSPLAHEATEITFAHLAEADAHARKLIDGWRHGRIPMSLHFQLSTEESRSLNKIQSGAVIIAGSGMCDGGRIRHHLARALPRPECAIVFCGFQAQGSLGRRIIDAAPRVRIFDQDVAVRAQRYTLGGLSSHADRSGLLRWLGQFEQPPRQTFVVHGEAQTAVGFAQAITEQLGWSDVQAPERGAVLEIG